MATNYNDILKGDLQSTNWQAYINQAKAEGNMQAAAQLEQKRNEKIATQTYQSSGGKQTQTNNYSQYLPTSSGSSKNNTSSQSAAYTPVNYDDILKGDLQSTDWQSYINRAVAEGNMQAAAQLEQKRNEKIGSAAYTGQQTQTNNYSQYLQEEPFDIYGSFEDFLADMGYGDYAAETQAAIQAAVNNAINNYRRQIETTNEDTEELARQAYISKMLGEKNLEQQLAANGYSGGLADSHRIALEATYENDLNTLEQQRAATVKELELAITNAQLTGDMQTAQELSNYLAQIQGQWSNYVQNQQSIQNQNYWNQQQMSANNQSKAREWALTLIQGGSMPDDVTLTAAGMTREQAQALLGNLAKPLDVRTPVYDNGGLGEEEIRAMQEAMGGVTVDGKWGPESQARAAALGYSTDPVKAYEQAQQGGYASVLADVQALKNGGENAATINNYISAALMSGTITAEEARMLRSSFITTGR